MDNTLAGNALDTSRIQTPVVNPLVRFLRNEKATAAIEFALIVPLLVLIVLGIITFGIIIYESAVLQGLLNNASREGKTGFPDISDPGTSGGTRWNNTYNMFINPTKALFAANKLVYTAKSYPTFTDAVNDTNGINNSIGTGGRVVVYTATYPYPNVPYLKWLLGSNNIQAYCFVKNENF